MFCARNKKSKGKRKRWDEKGGEDLMKPNVIATLSDTESVSEIMSAREKLSAEITRKLCLPFFSGPDESKSDTRRESRGLRNEKARWNKNNIKNQQQ